jgi:hypothetical protein
VSGWFSSVSRASLVVVGIKMINAPGISREGYTIPTEENLAFAVCGVIIAGLVKHIV